MASHGQDNLPSRPRLGARPFAGRPSEGPASTPARSHDSAYAPPFAAPVSRAPDPIVPASAAPAILVPPEAVATAAAPAAVEPAEPRLGAEDGLESVRQALDEELTHFRFMESERQRTPAPFPALDAVVPNEDTRNLLRDASDDIDDGSLPEAADVALRDPGDHEYASPWTDSAQDEGRALDEALLEARDVVHRDEVVQALEGVARRIRNGEIVVARDGLRRNEAGLLAAVLATLLGDRS